MRPSPTGTGRRDEGAVLPLVLVLMVISALIVIPMLGYAVSVLKANTVVSTNTRDREAAEADVRVALVDPYDLFTRCNGGTDPVPTPLRVIDAVSVTTTCELIEEVGPLNLIDFNTPVGATATQLGATLPAQLAGSVRTSPAVPPYPSDERWWTATSAPVTGETWLPDLPVRPSVDRSNDGYRMPDSFGCTVYLPGYYSEAVRIASGRAYFASGVYYFENDVVFEQNADVVVGWGLAGFDDSECADDIQVGANLLDDPGSFDIYGGGATFVFGADGHLVIDNSATTTGLSVQFNQRYAEAESGGRVSIMSVNGDETAGEHRVDDVVAVPRSLVAMSQGPTPIGPGTGTDYLPSSSRFTSEPRVPAAPAALTLQALTTATPLPPANDHGAVSVTWDEVAGQDTGGAVITEYVVEYAATSHGTRTTACTASSIVAPEPGVLGCVVSGLLTGPEPTFFVRARNSTGWSDDASATVRVRSDAPLVAAPEAPGGIVVTRYSDAAGIAWDAAIDNGAPILSYTVTAERMFLVPQAPDDDVDDDVDEPATELPPIETYEAVGTPCTTNATAREAAVTACVVTDLPPLDEFGDDLNRNIGYRFVITATNSVGASLPAIHVPGATEFLGGEPPEELAPEADHVVPYVPEPIVDLRLAAEHAPTTVSIPGYVSVPMGRIDISNPHDHQLAVSGGIVTSTLAIDPVPTGEAGSMPIGYKNDIVLQRRVKLVATAGSATVTAYVQVNENGDFKVNSWVVT